MGWTSQYFTTIIIEGNTPQTGIFIYSGSPQNGNLIGSWAAAAGTDAQGNSYPAGINVFQGQLSGVALNSVQIIGALINNAIINAPVISQPSITAGTILETNITFDPTGGRLLIYSTTTSQTTITSVGAFSFAAPSNVSSAEVQCWASGAGGGGGNASRGGESGGGGEYSAEPNYPLIGGNTYYGAVGGGGQGGVTGQGGQSGAATYFDGFGVFANPGLAGSNFNGGKGGTGSVNTIHYNGGNGANGNSGPSTGGSSGANSGGPSGAGSPGLQAAGTGGAGSPAPQTGAGTGGAGGNDASNGSAGGNPGAGGGGAGSGSQANVVTKGYYSTSSASYYGSDATGIGYPNNQRVVNGTMYQGGETASNGSVNGTQKSACLFPSSKIQSDFAGATMTGGEFLISNEHSWYNSGMNVAVAEWPASLGTSLPSSWNGTGQTAIGTPFVDEGAQLQVSLSAAVAQRFANGTDVGIALGPGPGSFNVEYYGYFSGNPGAGGAVLNLTGTVGSGVTQAGNGGNGQVIITYALTQTLIASISGQSGTDNFSNAYPAGIGILEPSGQYVKVSGASTDTTTYTCTSTSNTQMSKAWSIPAGDPATNTIYRFVAWGYGTQAGTTAVQLDTNLFLNGSSGTNLDNTNMGSGTIPAAANFHWRYQAEVIITATGSSGTAVVAGYMTWSQAVATTTSNAATSAISDTGKTINTTVGNTLGLFFAWSSTTNSPTITCTGSYLERLGP
jgi:hypothetical protein